MLLLLLLLPALSYSVAQPDTPAVDYVDRAKHLLPVIGAQQCSCPLTAAVDNLAHTVGIIAVTTAEPERGAAKCEYGRHTFSCQTKHRVIRCTCTRRRWHQELPSEQENETTEQLGTRQGWAFTWGYFNYCPGTACSEQEWFSGALAHSLVTRLGTVARGFVRQEFELRPRQRRLPFPDSA